MTRKIQVGGKQFRFVMQDNAGRHYLFLVDFSVQCQAITDKKRSGCLTI